MSLRHIEPGQINEGGGGQKMKFRNFLRSTVFVTALFAIVDSCNYGLLGQPINWYGLIVGLVVAGGFIHYGLNTKGGN